MMQIGTHYNLWIQILMRIRIRNGTSQEVTKLSGILLRTAQNLPDLCPDPYSNGTVRYRYRYERYCATVPMYR